MENDNIHIKKEIMIHQSEQMENIYNANLNKLNL